MARNRRSFLKLGAAFSSAAMLSRPAEAFVKTMQGLPGVAASFNHIPLFHSGNICATDASFGKNTPAVTALRPDELSKSATVHSNAQLKKVLCNYYFDDADARLISPSAVMRYGRFRIGLTAVADRICGEHLSFKHPYDAANATAEKLKEDLGCDLVVCFSDLAFRNTGGDQFNDTDLAASSRYIDLIISNNKESATSPHTMILKNCNGADVVLSRDSPGAAQTKKLVFGFNRDCRNHFDAELLPFA